MPAVDIRSLLRLTSNVIDICYDYRSGLRSAPAIEDSDIDRVTNQLHGVRDTLENLFRAATTQGTGSSSLALATLEPAGSDVSGLLSSCRSEMHRLEDVLQQETGLRSLNSGMVMSTLAGVVTALRSAIDGGRGYDPGFLLKSIDGVLMLLRTSPSRHDAGDVAVTNSQ